MREWMMQRCNEREAERREVKKSRCRGAEGKKKQEMRGETAAKERDETEESDTEILKVAEIKDSKTLRTTGEEWGRSARLRRPRVVKEKRQRNANNAPRKGRE